MRTTQSGIGAFQKVGECLYRYSNGVYYARIRVEGKEIKRSLGTTDPTFARRKLAEFKNEQRQIDRSQGKLSLEALCDRFLLTVQHQKPKTVERKAFIVGRIKADWPTAKLTQIAKIKPSDCDAWLARYKFGSASRSLHISCLKELFALAVRDRIITASPAAHLHSAKREKPIRLTPSWGEFESIIRDIRDQPFNADAEDSADFVEFVGLAGLGQAEAGALTWRDIHFERGQITTFRHKTCTGFAIPLYPQVRPLLERLNARRIAGDNGRVFRVKDAKKAISGACRRLGLPAYSHRSFRRMFITRAIEKGIDVKVIAQWQGHKDGGKLILDTYSHVNPVHSHRMAQLMTVAEPANIVRLPAAL